MTSADNTVSHEADLSHGGHRRGDTTVSRIGDLCRDICTFLFFFAVAALALAQQVAFGQSGGGRFKAAPKPPEPEEAEAASDGLDYIMGIHVNTLFFITASVIAIYWFTFGGGRKPKVSRDAK